MKTKHIQRELNVTWEVGQLKEASVCQLEGANTLDRIEQAMRELGLRNWLLEDDVW